MLRDVPSQRDGIVVDLGWETGLEVKRSLWMALGAKWLQGRILCFFDEMSKDWIDENGLEMHWVGHRFPGRVRAENFCTVRGGYDFVVIRYRLEEGQL